MMSARVCLQVIGVIKYNYCFRYSERPIKGGRLCALFVLMLLTYQEMLFSYFVPCAIYTTRFALHVQRLDHFHLNASMNCENFFDLLSSQVFNVGSFKTDCIGLF